MARFFFLTSCFISFLAAHIQVETPEKMLDFLDEGSWAIINIETMLEYPKIKQWLDMKKICPIHAAPIESFHTFKDAKDIASEVICVHARPFVLSPDRIKELAYFGVEQYYEFPFPVHADLEGKTLSQERTFFTLNFEERETVFYPWFDLCSIRPSKWVVLDHSKDRLDIFEKEAEALGVKCICLELKK